MKRWAAVVVALYGIILVIFTAPVLLVSFWEPSKHASGLDIEAIRSVYLHWPYWVGVAVFLASQAALLVIPVRISLERPVSRRTVWLPVITSAFMMALLTGAFSMVVSEAVRGKPFVDENIWLILSLAVLLASWVAWGVVFWAWSRKRQPRGVLDGLCQWLFAGSILELLVAVPTHIVVRNRDYCCAGIGTFCGITAGLGIMLLSFGPGVFFLFVERWKRLHPVAK